ncbi:hypothetical protein [Falsibacillus pallidus]|uniref:hypothetical protein n=1 Tax=Falsibacillus pallidus TaxID=493781 RepID=UPI003D964124
MRDDQFKHLKEELDREVFSQAPSRSKKQEILKNIQMKRNPRRTLMKKWIYPATVAAALFIVFLVSYPYIFHSNTKDVGDVPPSSAANIDKTPTKETAEETEKSPEENQKDQEQPAAVEQNEKSAEEWRVHFQKIWAQKNRSFDNLHLKYTAYFGSSKSDPKSSYIIDSTMENGKLAYNYKEFADDKFSKLREHLIYKDETQYLMNDSAKEYDRNYLDGNKNILSKDHAFDLIPIFPKYDLNSNLGEDNYKWEIDHYNKEENWVEITAEKVAPDKFPDATPGEVQKLHAKIDTENGILLSLKDYDAGGTLINDIEVTELAVNEQADKYKPDVELPAGYVSLEDKNKNKVEFKEEWVNAAGAEAKNNAEVADFFYSGEGGKLYFVLEFQDNADLEKAKDISKKFIETLTKNADSSKELKERHLTLWDDGQYSFTIRMDIADKSYEGDESIDKQNDVPQIKWKQPTKRIRFGSNS